MWAATCLASCCAGCACDACRTVVSSISRRSARIAYCGLFALSLVVSWILREVAAPLMEKLPCKSRTRLASSKFPLLRKKRVESYMQSLFSYSKHPYRLYVFDDRSLEPLFVGHLLGNFAPSGRTCDKDRTRFGLGILISSLCNFLGSRQFDV